MGYSKVLLFQALYLKTKPSTVANVYGNNVRAGKGNKKKSQQPSIHTQPLFYMYLVSRMVLGDGTVRLLFSLHKQQPRRASVIVVREGGTGLCAFEL